MSGKFIIGIDEVGRGPLAGPVAVGIVAMEKADYEELLVAGIFERGKDSKKLSPKKRDEYFEQTKKLKEQNKLTFGVFFESNEIIDRYGIVGAIKMAIRKGLTNLHIAPEEAEIMLDGWLKAPLQFLNQKSIVRGDESELIISLASIAAKVTRDKMMEKLSEQETRYDLFNNKGYGTAKHLADLKEYGSCVLHRQTFIKNLLT